ncbi:hypothetical protein MNBD_GAMMA19-1956 [hydrothermal vent metagenome]|uniref:Lipase n=1 Tax=hydrothermal vent metagenome TaxID=652676 RepID=A0A3B1B144_9ZZZZ
MDDELRQNMTASETWMRGLFMLLFVFLLVVARVVTGAVVVIQFLFTVFTGQCNANLREFGASLAMYVYRALLFVTYNSESKPFPFAPWPSRDDTELVVDTVAQPVAETPVDTLESDEPDKRSCS